MSIPHGIWTPHVAPGLKHSSWHSNTPDGTMDTTLKNIEPPTSCLFLKKKSLTVKFYFEIN